MADTNNSKEADITAENTWTAWLDVDNGERFELRVLDATFAATITIQMRDVSTDTDYAIVKDTITASGVYPSIQPVSGPCAIRAGVATGDFTSGTAKLRLHKSRAEADY